MSIDWLHFAVKQGDKQTAPVFFAAQQETETAALYQQAFQLATYVSYYQKDFFVKTTSDCISQTQKGQRLKKGSLVWTQLTFMGDRSSRLACLLHPQN